LNRKQGATQQLASLVEPSPFTQTHRISQPAARTQRIYKTQCSSGREAALFSVNTKTSKLAFDQRQGIFLIVTFFAGLLALAVPRVHRENQARNHGGERPGNFSSPKFSKQCESANKFV